MGSVPGDSSVSNGAGVACQPFLDTVPIMLCQAAARQPEVPSWRHGLSHDQMNF